MIDKSMPAKPGYIDGSSSRVCGDISRSCHFQDTTIATPETAVTMTIRERLVAVKADLRAKTKPSGWALPQQSSSFAVEGTWCVHTSSPYRS